MPTPEELIDLSHRRWDLMAARDTDALDALFHDDAVFVHMGATMTKPQELDVIREGGIHSKQPDTEPPPVSHPSESHGILLTKLRLTAVVGGNEVVNPFVTTEVLVRDGDEWRVLSLSFTRLLSD